MRFDNDMTRMLGVRYPIIQGAFGHAGTASLAVPVSEAGGLGILTSISYPTPEEFRQDIRRAREMTDKPFAVNFTLWKGHIDNEYHEGTIRVALDEGIKTIFTSGYDGSYIGRIFKDAGCNWIHKCATIKHAIAMADKGADAVVLLGKEGTGYKHDEQHTTLINITAARRLLDLPLIAAGGIGDARGFVGALAMGASAVYLGTAFMATKEFQAPDTFKAKIVDQEIIDPENTRKIYEMKHGLAPSLASGVIDSVPSIREFIERMIKEAEGIMAEFKQWGMLEP
jgi:nitronate monooxygenase